MSKAITVAEWRAELDRALTAPRSGDPGITIAELHAQTRLAPQRIRDALRVTPGLRHGRKARVGLDGRQMWVPCYWIDRQPGRK